MGEKARVHFVKAWRIVLLAAAVAGCAPLPGPGRVVVGPGTVDAPQGYRDLCARQPNAPECQR